MAVLITSSTKARFTLFCMICMLAKYEHVIKDNPL